MWISGWLVVYFIPFERVEVQEKEEELFIDRLANYDDDRSGGSVNFLKVVEPLEVTVRPGVSNEV